MAWDSSRPVPWRRLVREWFVYVALMTVVFLLFFRYDGLLGILGGLLASGPLYLGFGYVLAKLGYQRPTLQQRRDSARAARAATTTTAAPRPRPAPTRRTGGGAPRPGPKRRR